MLNVVVTGGGTIAPIDDVRSIANVSSGRFSASISEACLRLGANVWHIHVPQAELPLLRSARVDLEAEPELEAARIAQLRREWRESRGRLQLLPLPRGTVDQYEDTLREVLTTRAIDVAFLAMAVSDYQPVPVEGKIDSEAAVMTIRCHRTPKVIQSVRDWSPNVYLAGFKLLSRADPDELRRAAERACQINRADLTIANDLRMLKQGEHTLHLVRPGQPVETLGPSPTLADELVERVFKWVRAGRS